MRINRIYKEKMIRKKGEDHEQSVEYPNRAVKFNLKKQMTSQIVKRNNLNQKPKMLRTRSLVEGILKSTLKFTSSRLGRTRSEDHLTKDDKLHDSTRKEQDCRNLRYNNSIKGQYQRKNNEITKQQNFKDPYFPPSFSSLFDQAPEKIPVGLTSKVVWKRIPDIFPPKFFDLVLYSTEKPTNFNLITKGSQLCPDYLIEGLNSIRFNKPILQTLFENQKFNQKGMYHVTLFHDDKWQTFIIDDYIPVLPRRKNIENEDSKIVYKPMFSYISNGKSRKKNKEVQIWHYLLEKAYAKYYSSYGNLIEGNIFDFLWDVTGQVSESYISRTANIDWSHLNPGFFSVGLTDNLKKIPLTFHPNKDRVSFVTAEKDNYKQTIWPQDIPSFFPYIYGWNVNNYYYWSSVHIKQHQRYDISVITFEIRESTQYCLSLAQKDKRFFPKNMHYKYSWMRVIILEKQMENNYRWIDGIYVNSRVAKLQGNVGPGKYYILILPEWNFKVNQFNLILKANQPTVLVKETYEDRCFEKGCADMAQRFGRLNQLNKNLCSYNCIHEQMGMIIENINNEKTLGSVKIRRSISGLKPSHIQYSQKQGITIEAFNKQFSNGEVLEIQIKPFEDYTVILLMKGGIDHEFFDGLNFRNKNGLQ